MRASMILLSTLLLSGLPSPELNAQQTPPRTALIATHPMTNADVLALTAAGLSDDLVIAKIQAAPSTAFDTGVEGLKALKAASVSNTVIRAMIDPHAPSTVSPSLGANAAAGDPDDPNVAHSPGLYVMDQGPDGKMHLVRLEQEKPRGAKNSGAVFHALTYGIASSKTQSILDGAQATIALQVAKPVFYAYIPDTSSVGFVGGMSVKDLQLTRLEVKGDTRLWTFSAHGLFESGEIGNDEKNRQGFTSEQVRSGVYRLTPVANLQPGQYAFKYSAFFFDFGVQPQS